MAVSELPGNPNAVWTVKRRIDGKLFYSYACLACHPSFHYFCYCLVDSLDFLKGHNIWSYVCLIRKLGDINCRRYFRLNNHVSKLNIKDALDVDSLKKKQYLEY